MSITLEQRNFHTEWIKRTIDRLTEREMRGEVEVTLQTRELVHILTESLAMHQRSDRLEEVLCSYARYAFPVAQMVVPPAMFGGTVSGRIPSDGSTVTQVDKNLHRHIFNASGNGYDVCVDCGMSDVYYNWAYNKP